MRINYENNLNKLNGQIIEMAELVTKAIENAIRALVNKDTDLAQTVIEGDRHINSLEDQIETLSYSLLLKEQPVASDLRFVTSTLKMITDLERIGDQASDIAVINIKLSNRNYQIEDLGSIAQMAHEVIEMVKGSVKAFIDGDVTLIEEVLKRDDIVDEYFKKVREEVVADVKEDRFDTKNSLDLFMIAKYLERIGDHTENIAERVYYSITGQIKKV